MAPATARKKPEPAEPLTFEQITHKRMTERLTQYRTLVVKAAAGPLNAEELGEASDLLTAMGLPGYAWERDIAAQRQHDELVRAEAAAAKAQPEHERRALELVETIKRLDEELKAARAEHHVLASTKVMERIGLSQRINELNSTHPHLFMDPAHAAKMRLDARAKRHPTPGATERFAEGWST